MDGDVLLEYPCEHCKHTLKVVDCGQGVGERFVELFGPDPYDVKEEDIIKKGEELD
jgi:hypothetical protein